MPQKLVDAQGQPDTVKSTLIDWASWVLGPGGQIPALHHRFLLEQLDAISRGTIDRLMVLMPPGSAKSTYASILYPAWWFTQHPVSSVIATSHTTSLAEHFGRQVRDIVKEHGSRLGYNLHVGLRAAGYWQTSDKGEYFATGVRGPLTGRRADLVIIDDPIKSHAEADSPLLREWLWNWYRSDLTPRLKPKGRVVLVMARWHEDDLAGRLLAQNAAEWRIVCLPALALDNDLIGRAPGTALWPEWEDEAALLRRRDTVGERTWSAQYQQSPRPIQGSLFKIACIDILDGPPEILPATVVRAWDLAATVATGSNDPDWTVGVKLGRENSGRYVVLDVVRLRGSPHEVGNAITEGARIDGRSIVIGLPEDPGQAGKVQVTYLTAQLAGHRISSSRETGAKSTRAGPVASQVEARNVAMVRASWNHAFIEELRDFPFGRKDDQVDALSRAFEMLTTAGAPARTLSVSFLTRCRGKMFETICNLIPRDPAYPARARTLDILKRVLDGKLYDVLPYQFHEERGAGGEYIPLRSRRPSVRYALCRIVVEDSVSLLFSEGHFPTIDCGDRDVRAALADVIKETRLNLTMTEAAIRGSIGSVAVLMRVLRGRVFFDVLDTTYLIPEWDPEEPDTLTCVTEKYKVPGDLLASNGYDISDPAAVYWFTRSWDTESETWFVPVPIGSTFDADIDETRSVKHGLGFVPMVWIRNLPGPSSTGDVADGGCTFRAAIETQIEIDYQLSQAGRGLKYSSDPTLLIKEPASTDSEIVKGAGNALVVSEKGDAKLLEIGGTASAAVIEYVRTLRELALESVHGNRANADRLTAAQSGRALELMNQGLIWLADNLRISYGEGALLSLARMVLRASQVYRLRILGQEIAELDPATRLSLNWPRWYPSTADDRQKDAQTLTTLANAGQISRETAVKVIADTFDIEDVPAELARIAADRTTNGNS